MGYWQTKVLPKIKKVFDTKSAAAKKTAAAESTKSFDDSKEEINKEFEEKKTELQPKVIEIYEATSLKVKTLIKDSKEAGLKKNSTEVQKVLDELVKIEFPGSKLASESFSKFGASYASGPVLFVFEKVSTFIVTEDKSVEPPAAVAAEEPNNIIATTTEKEIVVEEPKEETSTAAAVEVSTTTATTTTTATPNEAVVVKKPEPEVAAAPAAPVTDPAVTEPTKAA